MPNVGGMPLGGNVVMLEDAGGVKVVDKVSLVLKEVADVLDLVDIERALSEGIS